MKILVVDDDKMILRAITNRLAVDGYQIITASNGMNALELLENENFDLVITDIMMPDLSGLNMISFLREFYSAKVPAIIISSLGRTNITYPFLKVGANEFILKPIDFNALSLSVKNF